MRAQRRSLILLVLVLLGASAGCGMPETAGTAGGEIIVTTVGSPPDVTAVAPATPTPANTPAPTATTAAAASATPPPETATPDAAATIVAGGEPQVLGPYPAPDGARRAEVRVYDCVSAIPEYETAYEMLLIVDEKSGEEELAATQLIACGGLGAFGLEGKSWSPEGDFFCFTDAREGVPDGCGFWQQPLSRVNTASGEVERLGPAVRSPDGTQLASWDGRDLVIWSVSGGQVGRSEARRLDAIQGGIGWSPDSTALVYAQYGSVCPFADVTLVHVELPEFTATPLEAPQMPAFTTFAWDAEDTLTLADEDGRRWFYDLQTNEITPAAEG